MTVGLRSLSKMGIGSSKKINGPRRLIGTYNCVGTTEERAYGNERANVSIRSFALCRHSSSVSRLVPVVR